MTSGKTFAERLAELRASVGELVDASSEETVAETARRLASFNYSLPIITPLERFLFMRPADVHAEIDRILAMPEAEACALAPGDSRKCEDLRLQYITVLLYYYKKLLELRKGNPQEWDEIDELYVHD